ncbi:hypothetical protein YTPLAS18_13690 [Nitrospira sp.]|nr:hypothetical protein YTPLAS18_13690 [Nitrospira sp.]
MTRGMIGLCLGSFSLCWVLGLNPAVAESKKQDTENKGTSLEDIKRGLKSAVQNVEKEIPKIGPAIGTTLNKIAGKESDKTSPQDSQKGKK